MRKQVLRCMRLETDKYLPDGHIEGEPFQDDHPVRFVWDKTPKQSAHNTLMKKRIISALKERRKRKPRTYRYLTDTDFKDRKLEDAFDQVYTTLRQKFRSQRDEFSAQNQKRREEHKAMKVRRLSRKKAVSTLVNSDFHTTPADSYYTETDKSYHDPKTNGSILPPYIRRCTDDGVHVIRRVL